MPLSTWAAAGVVSAGLLGVGVLADGIIAITPTTNAEAVWEATIISHDQILMKVQEPVYVRADDLALYAKTVNLSPLTTWSSSTMPLGVRAIRFDP